MAGRNIADRRAWRVVVGVGNMDVGDYKMTERIRRAGDDHGDTTGG